MFILSRIFLVYYAPPLSGRVVTGLIGDRAFSPLFLSRTRPGLVWLGLSYTRLILRRRRFWNRGWCLRGRLFYRSWGSSPLPILGNHFTDLLEHLG